VNNSGWTTLSHSENIIDVMQLLTSRLKYLLLSDESQCKVRNSSRDFNSF